MTDLLNSTHASKHRLLHGVCLARSPPTASAAKPSGRLAPRE